MSNAELKEITFVLLGYIIFVLVYYKFVIKRIIKEKERDLKILKAYVFIMFTMPIGFFVIAILSHLYNIFFGGTR